MIEKFAQVCFEDFCCNFLRNKTLLSDVTFRINWCKLVWSPQRVHKIEAGWLRTNQQVWTDMGKFAEQLFLLCVYILIFSLSLACPLTQALDFVLGSFHHALSHRAFSFLTLAPLKTAMLSFHLVSPHLEQGGSSAELCCLRWMRNNKPVHGEGEAQGEAQVKR